MSTFHGRTGAVYFGQETSVGFEESAQTMTIADHADFDFDETESFSLELWATIDAIPPIFLRKGDVAAEAGWGLVSDTAELSFQTYDKDTPSVSIASMDDSLPHHFVFVRDITNTKLYAYQDGAFSASTATFTTASDLSNTSDIVGQTNGDDWYLHQFRIYNTALTLAQVSDLCLGQMPVRDNRVGDWRATAGRGKMVWDSSENEHHATLSSASMWDTAHVYGTVTDQPCVSNNVAATSWTVSNVSVYPNTKITSVAESNATAIDEFSFTTNGKIFLRTAPASKPITATFKYYPVVNFALAFHNWSADYTNDAEETTAFGIAAPWPRSYIPGLTSWSGSAEKYLKTPECEGMLNDTAIVKLFFNESTNYRCEGWAVLTGVSMAAAVDAVVTETVNFTGTGALEIMKG